MEEDRPVEKLLVASLLTLAKKIEGAVDRTREDYNKADLYEFITYSHDKSHGIMKLLAVVFAYAECMKELGLRSKRELEQLWRKHSQEPGVKDAVENLVQAEEKFANFVADIERKVNPLENKLTVKDKPQVGHELPKEYSLIEIPSGQKVPIESCWKGAKFTLLVLLRLFG